MQVLIVDSSVQVTGTDVYTFILSACNDEYILRECISYGIDIVFNKYQELDKKHGLINYISVK